MFKIVVKETYEIDQAKKEKRLIINHKHTVYSQNNISTLDIEENIHDHRCDQGLIFYNFKVKIISILEFDEYKNNVYILNGKTIKP
jgi:hypothetical protein